MGVVADFEGHLPLAAMILSVGGETMGSGSPFLVILGSSSDFSGTTGSALELAPRAAQIFQNWLSLVPTCRFWATSGKLVTDWMEDNWFTQETHFTYSNCFTLGLRSFFCSCLATKGSWLTAKQFTFKVWQLLQEIQVAIMSDQCDICHVNKNKVWQVLHSSSHSMCDALVTNY